MTAGADILIRGAGPVGCTLALALQDSRHSVRLVDPQSAAPAGFRPIALSHASRLILERTGVWGAFPVTPILTIQVSQAGGFGRTRMDADDAGVPALGYVTQYAALLAALRARVTLHADDGPAARVTVHAEGSDAAALEHRYAHDAVVARVAAAPAPQAVAFERFTAEGPLALLPLAGEWALIWSARPERAAALVAAEPRDFLAHLQQACGERAGRFTEVHARAQVPLARRVRASRVEGREVYIGNAAQTLHPVAGQGLNLGLRDAWDLAQTLHEADDAGDARALARFAALRRVDAAATIGVTEVLARAFLGAHPLARFARGAVLTGLDVVPAARRFFARRMVFGPSALP
ncbi:MAG: FAD-dependent monooxygenase [Betaproteobacteria bacterium]|nr:FAD-dependent monooxygenase [Betaproteobacteria bacterium]MDH5210309.1 FAD-dependent monooxygenase [Betaproteobacteria bacterium]